MVDHYLENSDSTHTACGRSARAIMQAVIGGGSQGVTCKQCLKKIISKGYIPFSKVIIVHKPFGNSNLFAICNKMVHHGSDSLSEVDSEITCPRCLKLMKLIRPILLMDSNGRSYQVG